MLSPDVPDLDLVRAVLGGEPEAYGAIVARYQSMVASVAWRYGVPRGDIEDAVADVFVKVYRHLDRWKPTHAFSTWLYRVAVNEIVDQTRRRRHERDRVEMPEQIADRGPTTGQRSIVRERDALLHAALAELDPRYREVICLVHIEGLKVEEAAATLGIPDGTVKTRLMRGRQALREQLEQRWPEHFGDAP